MKGEELGVGVPGLGDAGGEESWGGPWKGLRDEGGGAGGDTWAGRGRSLRPRPELTATSRLLYCCHFQPLSNVVNEGSAATPTFPIYGHSLPVPRSLIGEPLALIDGSPQTSHVGEGAQPLIDRGVSHWQAGAASWRPMEVGQGAGKPGIKLPSSSLLWSVLKGPHRGAGPEAAAGDLRSESGPGPRRPPPAPGRDPPSSGPGGRGPGEAPGRARGSSPSAGPRGARARPSPWSTRPPSGAAAPPAAGGGPRGPDSGPPRRAAAAGPRRCWISAPSGWRRRGPSSR